MDIEQAAGLCEQVIDHVAERVLDKHSQIRLALSCLLARGHLLIEDLPGMGKTTLSHALAESLSLSFNRIQFTSDLLPADITGVSVYRSDQQKFEFHPGPIFKQLLLADEINRASPKTQSALLEAMAEQQVTVDGQTYPLPNPFFVIATQNPAEQAGTHPLPESQLDRFMMRISLGYPSPQHEVSMLKQGVQKQPQLAACISLTQLAQMQQMVEQVHASDALLNYLIKLVHHSRTSEQFRHPLSPRASWALLQAGKAYALTAGRNYLTADDLQAVFTSVCEHRLAGSQPYNKVLLSQTLLQAIDPVA
ncbi:AAA family ATPase [Gayadomonas joobiniege]|uniref:AAA family ATPase n=1 Tax=Gayadomonas joobiniege TaxID=1234606 RepID=UPI000371C028|nr:AAA family ATPase [Gayadomonas joobiniege]